MRTPDTHEPASSEATRGPAASRRLPILLLWFVPAGTAGYAVLRLAELPERVASHFGLSGVADGFMGKGTFLVTMIVTMALPAAMFTVIGLWLPRMSDKSINLPHRDYWLAPERRAETKAWFAGRVVWIGVATEVFLATLFCLVIAANTSGAARPRLGSELWVAVGILCVVVAGIIITMIRRFPRPPSSGTI